MASGSTETKPTHVSNKEGLNSKDNEEMATIGEDKHEVVHLDCVSNGTWCSRRKVDELEEDIKPQTQFRRLNDDAPEDTQSLHEFELLAH